PISHLYTLSLHDALPISQQVVEFFAASWRGVECDRGRPHFRPGLRRNLLRLSFLTRPGRPSEPATMEFPIHSDQCEPRKFHGGRDRKSTRLNSSHVAISY